ncbi:MULTISPECIES: hypothetical protein [Rhizobium]|uniref:Uncharacterized protein n=1 Tax=Rhizobium tumorigenes TaxID=2041385 RepID=A0AAF1KDS4_9HYPH|nr:MULTISPECIES: hypothetical protein [Rhizobium]MBO9102199.1 hypothetical protein [Rhizobium sp. L58/93]MBO9172296.1 hypothetical protein [Rhizobium sp. L245/93]MBO9188012.1 hypothetical protein [Rhizobium sp. E27B/91]QXZ87597.1 hypothetical protein J5287_28345 [Rhizobium sp. K1/93]QXZ93637.1 hypothetical protein J5280_28345 [Rhizobium sp. K15/93]
MIPKVDCRLGGELGLSKCYRDKLAFEIINDAHDLLGALTSRLITFKYGGHERFVDLASRYALADAKRIEFSRQLEGLNGSAVEAARQTEELNHFVKIFVDPWLTNFEEPRDNEG